MDFNGLEHDPLAVDCKSEVQRQLKLGNHVFAVQLHELFESYIRGTLSDKDQLLNKLQQCRSVGKKE